MPGLSAELVRHLLEAPPALVVAPRRGNVWEPLFARYDVGLLDVARRFAASGRRRLQSLLDEAKAHPLPLGAAELGLLDDWDSPNDLPESIRRGTGLS
jgi:molybdopterin-guanine dinucleotide biosynthesis protein A